MTDFPTSRPYSIPFGISVSRGLAGDGIIANHKFGRNGAVGNAVETLWTASDGLYSADPGYPTEAILLNLSSGDVDDNGVVPDTGARTVRIWGLDGDYEPITEDIILNGQTAVSTTLKYLRIFRMQVLTSGSSDANEGVVYAGTGGPGAGVPTVEYARIEILKGQTQMAMVTVPAGFTAYITSVYFSVGEGKTCNCELAVRPEGGSFNTRYNTESFQGEIDRHFDFPLEVTEKSDIELRGTNDVASQAVSGGFEYILLAN